MGFPVDDFVPCLLNLAERALAHDACPWLAAQTLSARINSTAWRKLTLRVFMTQSMVEPPTMESPAYDIDEKTATSSADAEETRPAKPITRDAGRGIQIYFWAYTSQHVLYLQDEGGDENWKVHVVDLATDTTRDVTPFDTIPGPDGQPIRLPNGKPLRPSAQIENVSHRLPESVLIGLNTRDPRYHDLYRLDIRTGALTLVQQRANRR